MPAAGKPPPAAAPDQKTRIHVSPYPVTFRADNFSSEKCADPHDSPGQVAGHHRQGQRLFLPGRAPTAKVHGDAGRGGRGVLGRRGAVSDSDARSGSSGPTSRATSACAAASGPSAGSACSMISNRPGHHPRAGLPDHPGAAEHPHLHPGRGGPPAGRPRRGRARQPAIQGYALVLPRRHRHHQRLLHAGVSPSPPSGCTCEDTTPYDEEGGRLRPAELADRAGQHDLQHRARCPSCGRRDFAATPRRGTRPSRRCRSAGTGASAGAARPSGSSSACWACPRPEGFKGTLGGRLVRARRHARLDVKLRPPGLQRVRSRPTGCWDRPAEGRFRHRRQGHRRPRASGAGCCGGTSSSSRRTGSSSSRPATCATRTSWRSSSPASSGPARSRRTSSTPRSSGTTGPSRPGQVAAERLPDPDRGLPRPGRVHRRPVALGGPPDLLRRGPRRAWSATVPARRTPTSRPATTVGRGDTRQEIDVPLAAGPGQDRALRRRAPDLLGRHAEGRHGASSAPGARSASTPRRTSGGSTTTSRAACGTCTGSSTSSRPTAAAFCVLHRRRAGPAVPLRPGHRAVRPSGWAGRPSASGSCGRPSAARPSDRHTVDWLRLDVYGRRSSPTPTRTCRPTGGTSSTGRSTACPATPSTATWPGTSPTPRPCWPTRTTTPTRAAGPGRRRRGRRPRPAAASTTSASASSRDLDSSVGTFGLQLPDQPQVQPSTSSSSTTSTSGGQQPGHQRHARPQVPAVLHGLHLRVRRHPGRRGRDLQPLAGGHPRAQLRRLAGQPDERPDAGPVGYG